MIPAILLLLLPLFLSVSACRCSGAPPPIVSYLRENYWHSSIRLSLSPPCKILSPVCTCVQFFHETPKYRQTLLSYWPEMVLCTRTNDTARACAVLCFSFAGKHLVSIIVPSHYFNSDILDSLMLSTVKRSTRWPR